MHKASFQEIRSDVAIEEPDLLLSGEASEWLFYRCFWEDLNKRLGTLFAHYEEERLRVGNANHVATSLRELCADLHQASKFERFIIGYSADGQPRYAEITTLALRLELEGLANFFDAAAADIECSL